MRHARAMWALAKLDLLMWRRSPMAVATALIPSLGMALLLVVLTLSVGRQPVALVIQSHGHHTNRLAKLIQSDDDAYMLTQTDPRNAAAMLKDQRVAATITIPPNFERSVGRHSAHLDLTLNNIDIDFSDDIRRSVERSTGEFDGLNLSNDSGKDDSGKDVAGNGGDKSDETAGKGSAGTKQDAEADAGATGTNSATDPTGHELADHKSEDKDDQDANTDIDWEEDVPNLYHIAVAEHDLRETNVDFLHYQVVPALILLVLSVGLLGTALHCAADCERGTARLLVLSPASPWVLVAGRILGGATASIIALIFVGIPALLTHTIAPPENHWPALAALFLLTAICASGLGSLLGTCIRGQKNIAMASSILATYLFFMGGGFTTVAFLPAWIKHISALDPMRYAIDGTRQALFYPNLTGVPADLMVLAAAALLSVLIGSLFVLKSWSDQ